MRLNVSLSVSKLVGPVGHIDEGTEIPEFNSLRTALKFVITFAKQCDFEIKSTQEKYGTNFHFLLSISKFFLTKTKKNKS